MKKNLKISVNNPCGEDYQNFDSTAKGGFCNSCQKEVIDFTNMNELEVKSYFEHDHDQIICGRFRPEQLKVYDLGNSNSLTSFRAFTTGAIGVLLSAFLGTNTAVAQTTNPTHNVEQNENSIVSTAAKSEQTNTGKRVSGIVTGDQEPLPGVNIVLQGSDQGTTTDFDGKYTFPTLLKKGDVLLFHYLGFESASIVIGEKEMNTVDLKIDVSLDTAVHLVGEVATEKSYKSKRSYWKRLKTKE